LCVNKSQFVPVIFEPPCTIVESKSNAPPYSVVAGPIDMQYAQFFGCSILSVIEWVRREEAKEQTREVCYQVSEECIPPHLNEESFSSKQM
jgi:hypothetical protein